MHLGSTKLLVCCIHLFILENMFFTIGNYYNNCHPCSIYLSLPDFQVLHAVGPGTPSWETACMCMEETLYAGKGLNYNFPVINHVIVFNSFLVKARGDMWPYLHT